MRFVCWCWWMLGLGGAATAQAVPWRATEVLHFADVPPNVALARVDGVAVDSAGRFYVLDGLNSEVYVFGPDGRHVTTIGRRGAGPGEFSNQAYEVAIAGDRVAVYDVGNQRVSVFTREGRLLDDFLMSVLEGLVGGFGGLPDGTLLLQREPAPMPPGVPRAAGAPDRPLLLRLAADGTVLDTLYRFPPSPTMEFVGGAMRMRFPDARPVWAVDAQGRVALGRTDRYELRWWHDGTLSAPWGRQVARLPMTAEFRETIRRRQDSLMEVMVAERGIPRVRMVWVFPDSFPVLGAVFPGPFGTLLVVHGRGLADDAPRAGGIRVDVFEPDGAYLGVWDLPAGFRLMTADGDRLYGVRHDADDLPSIVVYRVERFPG